MMIGMYDVRVQPGGRVQIPPELLFDLNETGEVSLVADELCVALYPGEVAPANSDPLLADYPSSWITQPVFTPIDAKGYVRLPPDIAYQVGLTPGAECVVTGAIDHVELWNRERWWEELDRVWAELDAEEDDADE